MAREDQSPACPFITKLPAEVRAIIYSFAVREDEEITPKQVTKHSNKFVWGAYTEQNTISPDDSIFKSSHDATGRPLTVCNLYWVCRVIKTELDYFGTFYKVNTFCFCEIAEIGPYITAIKPRNRASMRSVAVMIKYSDTWKHRPTSDGWAFLQHACPRLETLTLRTKVFIMDSHNASSIVTTIERIIQILNVQPCGGLRGIKNVDVHVQGSTPHRHIYQPHAPISEGGFHNIVIRDFSQTGNNYLASLDLRAQAKLVAAGIIRAKLALTPLLKAMMQPRQPTVHTAADEMRFRDMLLRTGVTIWGESHDTQDCDDKPGLISSRTRSMLSRPLSALGVRARQQPMYTAEGYFARPVLKIEDARVGNAMTIAEFYVQRSYSKRCWVTFDALMQPGVHGRLNLRRVAAFYNRLMRGGVVSSVNIPNPLDFVDKTRDEMGQSCRELFVELGERWGDRSPRADF